MAKKKVVELHVVFDTNALYTGAAHYLINRDVHELIDKQRESAEPHIVWHLPEIVRDERHFQMLQEARKFLGPVEKLQRLLGHNLNITEDILQSRVKESITAQITEHGLQLIPLNHASVDWSRLVGDAAFRRPPFEDGEHEKGFRDALVLESFLQLQQSIASIPSSCRLVLVSRDTLLGVAALDRTKGAVNVHILASVESLKGLINTLSSEVDEQFIADLQPRVEALFLSLDNKKSLTYKWDLRQKVFAKLTDAHMPMPAEADDFTVKKWTVNKPRFLKKEGQKVSWVSRFEGELIAQKRLSHTGLASVSSLINPFSAGGRSVNLSDLLSATGKAPSEGLAYGYSSISPVSSGLIGPFEGTAITLPQMQDVKMGTATVDVTWAVSVNTDGRLTAPHLDDIVFVDVVWD